MHVFSEGHPVIAVIALAQVLLDVAASAMFFAVYDDNVGV
jgi:hypothetical protein